MFHLTSSAMSCGMPAALMSFACNDSTCRESASCARITFCIIQTTYSVRDFKKIDGVSMVHRLGLTRHLHSTTQNVQVAERMS